LPIPDSTAEDGNNPNLQPSKTQTHTLSVTFAPKYVPGLTVSGEFSAISQHGFRGESALRIFCRCRSARGRIALRRECGDGQFPGFAGGRPFTAPGQLGNYLRANPNNATNLYAVDRFMNLGGVKVRAYTLNAAYELPTIAYGTFGVSTSGTIFDSFEFQALPYQKFYQYAGYATNGGTGVQGTLPKYRFYTSFDWHSEHWSATLANTFASSVTDIGAGGIVFETSKTLKPLPGRVLHRLGHTIRVHRKFKSRPNRQNVDRRARGEQLYGPHAARLAAGVHGQSCGRGELFADRAAHLCERGYQILGVSDDANHKLDGRGYIERDRRFRASCAGHA